MANPVKIQARVSDILVCGSGVYKVSFTSSNRDFPRFRPGQFLHLTVDEFDPSNGFWPESRVFSIASCPGSNEVVIVYAVKGGYTRKMEDYLSPGKDVWLKFPYGEFIIDNAVKEGRNVVLIAGGTGVSPFIPFLEVNNEDGWKIGTRVHLAYGLRSSSQMVFADVYREALKYPKTFSMDVFLENTSEPLPFECGGIFPGMLSVDKIVQRISQDCHWVFYLSGPPAMLSRFRDDLVHHGVRQNDIKIDEW